MRGRVEVREAYTERSKKKRSQSKKSRPTKGRRVPALPQPPHGMPAADHVIETTDFVSPQGAKYTILKTTETDAYDPPLTAAKKQRKGR
jgi:hypothetical protein